MSYVQSMAKKNLYLSLSADVIGSSLCLVWVSSDVNVSCLGEGFGGGGVGVHTGNPQRSSTWTHGPDLSQSKSSAESIQGLGSVLWEEDRRSCHRGHVALTSMMWSSVAGSTRTCRAWLWLNTCPGLKGSRRGIATPFCCWSPLPTEWTLPRLRMLAVSPWSSSVLSSRDRLSFSTQLSKGGNRQANYFDYLYGAALWETAVILYSI